MIFFKITHVSTEQFLVPMKKGLGIVKKKFSTRKNHPECINFKLTDNF